MIRSSSCGRLCCQTARHADGLAAAQASEPARGRGGRPCLPTVWTTRGGMASARSQPPQRPQGGWIPGNGQAPSSHSCCRRACTRQTVIACVRPSNATFGAPAAERRLLANHRSSSTRSSASPSIARKRVSGTAALIEIHHSSLGDCTRPAPAAQTPTPTPCLSPSDRAGGGGAGDCTRGGALVTCRRTERLVHVKANRRSAVSTSTRAIAPLVPTYTPEHAGPVSARSAVAAHAFARPFRPSDRGPGCH